MVRLKRMSYDMLYMVAIHSVFVYSVSGDENRLTVGIRHFTQLPTFGDIPIWFCATNATYG